MTALYTVLTEGDDHNDPVADAARAILDGHIVLSRRIADSNLYPAIDIDASVSRAMHSIVSDAELQLARQFARINAAYEQQRDLINVGAYEAGSDPRVDLAIRLRGRHGGVPTAGDESACLLPRKYCGFGRCF